MSHEKVFSGPAPRTNEVIEAICARRGKDYSQLSGAVAGALHITNTIRQCVRDNKEIPPPMPLALMHAVSFIGMLSGIAAGDVSAIITALCDDADEISKMLDNKGESP